MNKVLIITYYWPPVGGAGVQRWLKFAKYLRTFGWEPVIYTPENPELFSADTSLEKDIPGGLTVLKTKIWEPYSLYRKFTGRNKEEKVAPGFISEKKKPGLPEKIAVWIRGNFFIPDARVFWIKPSVKFLARYLQENKVEAIVSSGPPHSMHLIGLELKKKFNLPWLVDFRDPWTNIDFYDQLMLCSFADKKHRRMEKEVLEHADAIVTIGWNLAQELQQVSGKKINVITNGFDEEDFPPLQISLTGNFSICHTGAMNKDRNPVVFWEALRELLTEIQDMSSHLCIRLIGKTDYHVLESIKQNGLEKYMVREEYVSHQDAIRYMRSSYLLLLPLNNTPNVKGIVTGKLFEYIASRRPVLMIGDTGGDAASILAETGAGDVCDFNDKQKIKLLVAGHYKKYREGSVSENSAAISVYSRKSLTGKLSGILDNLADNV